MSDKRVAILGCGPAGMMAAHACAQADMEFWIFSVKKKSRIGGAQYLYREIPGLTEKSPGGSIRTIHRGEPENYAERVYGDPKANTSWYDYPAGTRDIWNMREAYSRAWNWYEDRIQDRKLNSMSPFTFYLGGFDAIFSCVPLKTFCYHGCSFTSQDVWITDGSECGDMEVVYNGLGPVGRHHHPAWYRESRIFGHGSQEWGFEVPDSVKIDKPLSHNCPGPANLGPAWVPLGRYGKWKKGELIHHAYEGAISALHEMQQ